MTFKPEYFPLVLNAGIFAFYAWEGQQPGKIFYWLGATILTYGLLRMRG